MCLVVEYAVNGTGGRVKLLVVGIAVGPKECPEGGGCVKPVGEWVAPCGGPGGGCCTPPTGG